MNYNDHMDNLSDYNNCFLDLSISSLLPIRNKKVKFRIEDKFYEGKFICANKKNQEYYASADDKILEYLTPFRFYSINFSSIKYYFKFKSFKYSNFVTHNSKERKIHKIVGSYETKKCIVFCDIPNPTLIAKSAKNNYLNTIKKMHSFSRFKSIITAKIVVDLAIQIKREHELLKII